MKSDRPGSFDHREKAVLAISLVAAATLAVAYLVYFSVLLVACSQAGGLSRLRSKASGFLHRTASQSPDVFDAEVLEFQWFDLVTAGDYDSALAVLRQALATYLERDDPGAARAYANLGYTHHLAGEPGAAFAGYARAVAAYRAAGEEDSGYGISLGNLKLLLDTHGQDWFAEQATESLPGDEARLLMAEAEASPSPDAPAMAPLFEEYDPGEMIVGYRFSSDSCLAAGDTMMAANYLVFAGYTFAGEQNRDSSLACHRQALALLETLDNPLLSAGGRLGVASAFRTFGMPESALVEYLAAHDLYRQQEDTTWYCHGAWWLRTCLDAMDEERFLDVCRSAGRSPEAAAGLLDEARNAEQPAGG